MENHFNLPTLAELKKLSDQQLKNIFFQLEQHRAKQLLELSEIFSENVENVNKDYTNAFNVLASVINDRNNKE